MVGWRKGREWLGGVNVVVVVVVVDAPFGREEDMASGEERRDVEVEVGGEGVWIGMARACSHAKWAWRRKGWKLTYHGFVADWYWRMVKVVVHKRVLDLALFGFILVLVVVVVIIQDVTQLFAVGGAWELRIDTVVYKSLFVVAAIVV
jgi:hypothetical protein